MLQASSPVSVCFSLSTLFRISRSLRSVVIHAPIVAGATEVMIDAEVRLVFAK